MLRDHVLAQINTAWLQRSYKINSINAFVSIIKEYMRVNGVCLMNRLPHERDFRKQEQLFDFSIFLTWENGQDEFCSGYLKYLLIDSLFCNQITLFFIYLIRFKLTTLYNLYALSLTLAWIKIKQDWSRTILPYKIMKHAIEEKVY